MGNENEEISKVVIRRRLFLENQQRQYDLKLRLNNSNVLITTPVLLSLKLPQF